MTNNPTIDGVSRLIPLELLRRLSKNYNGRPTWDALSDERAAVEELRALLDAPAVERQDPYGFASVLIDNFRHAIDNGKQPTFSKGDLLWLIEQLSKAQSESAALQSTIAQLQARVQELESGRGEPVMKLEAKRLWGGAGEYAVSFVKSGWLAECRKTGGEFLLYTAPPAPVAVVPDERAAFESNYKPEALERDGDEYVRMPVQMAWEGWIARACLDATAALNGDRE